MIPARQAINLHNAIPFWMSLLLVPVAILGATVGGWTVILLPIVTWYFFSILDAILGLNLAFDPHGATVGVVSFTCGSEMRLLVDPGRPERSHVMNKLMGANMCGGEQMPPKMPQPQATLRMIADWICAGAPD